MSNFIQKRLLSSYRVKKTEDKKDRDVLIVFLSVLIALLVAHLVKKDIALQVYVFTNQ